jgi:hypothetical protein
VFENRVLKRTCETKRKRVPLRCINYTTCTPQQIVYYTADQKKEDETVGAEWLVFVHGFCGGGGGGNEGNNHLEDSDLGDWIILKWILHKLYGTVWAGYILLRIWTSGEFV